MNSASSAAAVAVLWILAGCSRSDANRSSGDTRLPTASVSAPATGVDDTTTLASYTLDMNKIDKLTTFMRNAAAYRKAHPGEDIGVSLDGTDNLNVSVRKIESNPTAKELLEKSRLTAREYVLIISSYLGAGMTVSMLEANPNATIPSGVNPRNVDFLRAHKAELEQVKKEMEASG